MTKSVMMAELSWTDYQRLIKSGVPVILPTGATEQHGPHLPMGVDVLIPTAIARAVAQDVGGLVAPPITYGYKSQPKMGGGQHFCGTTSLDAATFAHVLRDVIKELARHGVRRVMVLNGHYENMMFTIEGIDLAMRELRYDGCNDMTVLRLEYWDYTREETLAALFPAGFPGYALEHAAVMETSLMLHLYPDLVDLDKLPTDGPASFPPYDVYPTRTALVPCSGVLSPAQGASAGKGALLFKDYVEGVSAAMVKEFELKSLTVDISLQVSDIAHVIQIAVGPVFLLTGIAGFLSVLSMRLGRIVDRARVLEDRLANANPLQQAAIQSELSILCRRARLINWSIILCTACGLLVCLVIMILFVNAFLGLKFATVIALIFIVTMAALIIALLVFLQEIRLGTSSLRIGPQ